MNGNHSNDIKAEDLLAAYELGLLDDDEKARFEAATLENPDLLDELYEMAPHVASIRRRPDLAHAAVREALDASRPSIGDRLRGWADRFFSPRVLTPVAVAAAVALVIFNLGERPADLRRLVTVDPMAYVSVDVRSGETDRDAAYRAAMDAYSNADYRGAIDGLERAVAGDWGGAAWDDLDQARLYLGVCHLLADEPAAAVPHLETGAASWLPPVADGSKWYLAQARLMLGDVAAAREILADLGANSPVYGARAADLLARIDQLIHG